MSVLRVCLDTNVLVSGIFWKGFPGKILDAWADAKFDLIMTLAILDEYKRVLRKFGEQIDQALAEMWIKVIIEKTLLIVPSKTYQKFSRDVTDDMFVHCCLSGKADFLVTGDKDLLVLKDTLPFKILKARDFLSEAALDKAKKGRS